MSAAVALDSGLRQARTSTHNHEADNVFNSQKEGIPSEAQRGLFGEGCRVLATDLDESRPPGDGWNILDEDTRAGWFSRDLLGTQVTIVGDVDLLGAAPDFARNDSRAGWFGRGLGLAEPVSALQNPAGWLDGDTGMPAQTSFGRSGLLPANDDTGTIMPLGNYAGCPTGVSLERQLVQESQASGRTSGFQNYGGSEGTEGEEAWRGYCKLD
jgi:hypothetical protein